MNIVLLGKSGSGKSTVAKFMSEFLRYERSIDLTTRPARDYEKDGVDYFFVDEDKFDIASDDGILIAEEEFNNWYFGALDHTGDDNIIYVSNPSFFYQMLGSDMDFISIYIEADKDTRVERLLNRGDSLEEIERRLKADDEDFEDVIYDIDYVVDTKNDTWDVVKEILNIVKYEEEILSDINEVE